MMVKVFVVLGGIALLFMLRPRRERVVLVPPGVNVIEEYGPAHARQQRRGCAPLIGPVVVILLVGSVLFIVQRATATPPEPTPLPTIARVPTSTITPTLRPSSTRLPTSTPWPTGTATHTATSTPTITPTYTPSHTPSATLRPFVIGQVIDANELNVRYGPSLNHAAFDRLQRDEQVQIVGRDNGARWACFHVDGGLGWVSMAYIWTDENIARLPVMEAPPGDRIGK